MPRNTKRIREAPRARGKPAPPRKGPAPKPQGSNAPKKGPLQANQRPIVPFLRKDRILLIGEGDFSFARALATQYKCPNICATSYDSKETLFSKYPQAEENVETVLSKPDPSDSDSEKESQSKVLFSVDARKLGTQTGGGKELVRGFDRRERRRPAWFTPSTPDPPYQSAGAWDVICFNFPHVGGLSTDVNRQVRANQELLVAFFKACVPLLSKPPPLVDADEGEYEYEDGEGSDVEDEDEEENDDATTGKGVRTGPGQILVTLFEGEPYTLWNIKDLARHAGLVVVTSFKFPWSSYEGYSHARTVGHIENKDGERGWVEGRGSRGENVKPKEKKKGKKRSREDSSDSE
ncbi:hypothetical protein N7452_002267 [Penicillium brevicompactum]|uniref:25S rRNA (uridine-N(3))-methyltransferase BMT5-like domain-containing protein n=1 Tax=Penicillium brevicompactum TaxID=5074 RepID=A0A9W9R9F0_PENBR|nr:hypothetical protein N7452_002267 [Penicillium brevicompactum]